MKKLRRISAFLLLLVLLAAPVRALTAAQTAELLERYYIDPLPTYVLEQTSVEDMLSALGDPYTEYFDAKTYAAFLDSMKDSVTYGIGVTMRMDEGGILITDVLPGLGAEKAGIRAGDMLTAVDGQSAAGMTMDTVRTWISGPEGTVVQVTVLRNGVRQTFTVTRAKVVVPATATALMDGHIGYIASQSFGPETLGHFEDGVTAYDAQADRWVVDLRFNGGGDVDASVQSAGVFAGGGELAYIRDGDGNYGSYARRGGSLTLDPVVVLTSRYTASAAELFSAIVRDRRAGLLVGERTYGKGVAQILLDEDSTPQYFSDGSALKVTAYRIYSPDGATGDKVGIIPHLLVDEQWTEGVGYLLSASNPRGDTTGKLRLDLGWRWYIDLETAMREDLRPVFTALLEAIPDHAPLWVGTGGSDGWRQTTPAQAAAKYGLTGYQSRGFSDTDDNPHTEAISVLATYGLVAGVGDGTFQPQENLTRGQLCVLLSRALRYESTGTGTFSDVDAGAYYAPAVEAMYAAGLVTGSGGGLFRPDDPIDHQQYMTVLARLAKRLSIKFSPEMMVGYEGGAGHSALQPYPQWARESVWLLDGSQQNPLGMGVSLLWEELTAIDPTAPTTRAEAAAGLYNLLAHTGILPG